MNEIELMNLINSCLKEILGDKAELNVLSEEDKLFEGDLCLTSYEYMQLIFTLEKEFGILFDNTVWEYNTVSKVKDLVSCIKTNKSIMDSTLESSTFSYYRIIEKNSKIFRNHNAIICTSGESITYEQLWKYIQKEISELKRIGIKRGDNVLFYLPNSKEFVVNYFACAYIGAKMFLCDIKLEHEIETIIIENKIDVLLINDHTQRKINKILENNSTLYDSLKIKNVENNIKDIQVLDDRRSYKEIDSDSVSIILFTSGSEGKPKGVENSYKNITEALKNYCKTVHFSEKDKLLAVTPFFHSYAMGSCFLAGLASGATLVLLDSFQPYRVLELIEKYKITVFHGVPYMYKILNHLLATRKSDTSTLRMCINAAGRLEIEEAEKFGNLTGQLIHQEYGSTETGTIAFLRESNFAKDVRCVGKPLEGVEVKILNPDSSGIGRVEVTSRGISEGYFHAERFTKVDYVTGDLGYFDENGQIILVGREKRFINISGIKVSPYEIEDVLISHPKVLCAYVYGVKSNEFGEKVKALVVRKDESLTKEELLNYCKARLATFKVPSWIEWKERLDTSQLGKIKITNQI